MANVSIEFNAGASGYITGSFTDTATGTVTQPTALNWTLFDRDSNTIIGSHNNESLTPATVAPSGVLAHYLATTDNNIINSANDLEIHVARYIWTWGSPTKTGIQEIQLNIRKLTTPT